MVSVKWMLKSVNSAGSKPEPVCPVVSLPLFSFSPGQDLKEGEKSVSMCSKNSVSKLQNLILFDLCIYIKK